MGDLTESIFFRPPCPVDEGTGRTAKDGEWLGRGSEIAVLEIGGQRASNSHRISNSEELRRYVDLQNQLESDDEDSCWQGLQPSTPRSLKLFFLMSRDDDRVSPSVMAKSLPDIIETLHSKSSSSTMHEVDDSDDEPLSPSSSPREMALAAHTRNPRFPLTPFEETRVTQAPSPQGYSPYTWTWETRYLRSTTMTVAEPTGTAYFFLDFPEKLQKRISKTIHSLQALATNPLFMDTLIVDEIINFYRDAIKKHRSQMQAMNDDDSNTTEVAIKLEELAAQWKSILRDIHSLQTHIHHLQVAAAPTRTAQQRSRSPSPHRRGGGHQQHTRQQSSEVLGPQSAEIFKLQHSTCEFWARCVNLYLERTMDRIRTSQTYRLKKTIPLRRRGSLPQLNRRLSNFTIEVAVQFQRNGSSVSTLALSFLSTIFVSPDGLVLAITHWWWIFVTLIIPLTCIIIHLWFETLANNTAFLRRRKVARNQQQLEELTEEQMD